MSSVAISGNASGAGVLTIAAPNTASNYTLTLPTATTTLVGTNATQTLTNKTLTSPTLTTPNIDSAQIPTVSGTAPLYMCRAWVNFNGTGTVAIRASGNVSSITDNGTGDYTVNFTNAMPDANYGYACNGSIRDATSNNVMLIVGGDRDVAPTSSALRINTVYNNSGVNTSIDAGEVCASVFR